MKTLVSKCLAALRRNRKTIVNFSFILLAVVALSLISFFVLQAAGVVTLSEGDLAFNPDIFTAFSSQWYGWIFFILLQTVLSILLCVFPGVSMALIIISTTVVFPGKPLSAFLLCFASVAIASHTMYVLGRFGGYPLCVRLVGREDAERALDLLRDKGTFFFPFMMLFPFFPDEALTMVAGTIRMKLAWFLPSILIARGIGIATIVFGVSFLPFDRFTTFWHWFFFVLAVLLLVGGVLTGALLLRRHLEQKNKK